MPKVIPGKILELLLCLIEDRPYRRNASLHTSLSTFMVWAVCILHTWALWAGSVNLVTAQEFCPVYYFIWAYTVMLHALTLTSRVFLCTLAILINIQASSDEGSDTEAPVTKKKKVSELCIVI